MHHMEWSIAVLTVHVIRKKSDSLLTQNVEKFQILIIFLV